MAPDEQYDAVIVGAGMSSLVCGCYLAKAGMKVLIAERHHKPGGYCTSFKRKGFVFDAAAHSFGSYRPGGTFNTVLDELGLKNRIKINRFDPSDSIETPDYRMSFWNEPARTVDELQKLFSHENRLGDLFQFLASPKPIDIAALRYKTFQDLLDQYLKDDRLKAILSFPLFGNGGLPPSLMSAFTGSKIFTEFMVDGGYYPEGGMQKLPDALATRFLEFGGVLRLSSQVRRITVKDDAVGGVVLESGETALSRCVISNADARSTFFDLLGQRYLDKSFAEKLAAMKPSLSMFVIYLGIDNYFSSLPPHGSTLWYLPGYNLENMYLSAAAQDQTDLTKYLFRVSPDGKSILAMTNTSFKDKQYWDNNKFRLLDSFIQTIERTAIPNLTNHIAYKECATPHTLHKYTLNHQGSAYGWESTLQQFIDSDFRIYPLLQGLYLTGHWTTYAQGLAGVVYLGRDLARTVLKRTRL